MAIKWLLTSVGRIDLGAGSRNYGGRWSVAWLLLAAVLMVTSASPMGLPVGLVYAQDEAANSDANATEDQAEAQPAEEQPAEEQPPEDQGQSEPAQNEAGAAPEAVEGEMTEEEANRIAEEVIRELDERMANDPEFARQVKEQEALEAQRAAELEAEQQQYMEQEAEQERLQQEQRMAELEAEQQAFQEQERQRQQQGQPTAGPQGPAVGEGQPATPPGGLLEHPPGRSLQQPTGTVKPRPIDQLREQRERRKAAAAGGQPAPVPVDGSPNEAAPASGDMRLDARNLPDVSQQELEALKNRIVKTTPQGSHQTTRPAAVRPSAPITGTAGVPAVGPGVPVPAPPGATVPKDQATGTPDLKSQPKWWVLKAEDRPYFFAWKNTPLDRACQDLCEMSGLSMMGLNMVQPTAAKPLTFQSVKIMDYDEALLTFDLLAADMGYWVLRREDYLEIRPLNEWSRYVSPARMYGSVEEYRQAKVPPWELVSVIYEPKERSAEILQAGVVALVPINTTWASVIQNTNRLEIRSFAYYLDKQLEWLGKNDLDMGGDGRELRVYVLKHSSPESAANLLQTMLPPSEVPPAMSAQVPSAPVRPGTPRPPTPQPQASVGSTADTVEITEDSRLNRLLVRATASKHAMVKEYLEKYIDLPLEGGQSELIKLEHSDPATLVEMIKPMLVEQQIIQAPVPQQPNQPQPRTSHPPTVPRVVTQASNAVLTPIDHMKAILVKAEPDDMAKIKQYVQILDVPQEKATHHYITLEHASATSVVSILNDALGVTNPSRRSIGVPSVGRQDFKAIPDLSSDRSMVILGESKDVEDAKALIAKLDVDPLMGASQHLVRLKSAPPSSVSAVLQGRFGGSSGGGGGPSYHRGATYRGSASGSGSLPQFIADDESKMLIVVCSDKEWPQIEGLMKELDASAEVANTTKAYRLKHASAANLSNILSQSFGSGRGGYRSYGGSPGGPSFQYEPSGNVLLVTANDEVHTKVADLVRELDQPSPSDQAELRVIELEKAEAEYVAGKMEELLGIESSSRYGRTSYRGSEGAPKVPVQIVAESVGNRILITSSEEDFKKAEDLAKQIDKEYATQEFERRTFVLKYAPASQIRMAIEAMFGSGGASRSARYGYGGSSSTPGAIKISDVGNGLVVLAPKS